MWDTNYHYSGNHVTVHKCNTLICCIPSISTMSYVKYISVKTKQNKRPLRQNNHISFYWLKSVASISTLPVESGNSNSYIVRGRSLPSLETHEDLGGLCGTHKIGERPLLSAFNRVTDVFTVMLALPLEERLFPSQANLEQRSLCWYWEPWYLGSSFFRDSP